MRFPGFHWWENPGCIEEKQDTTCTAVAAYYEWLRAPGLNALLGWYRDMAQVHFFSIAVRQWLMVLDP